MCTNEVYLLRQYYAKKKSRRLMLGGSPQPSSPGVKLVEDNPTGYDGLEALQPFCCDIGPGCVGQIKIGFVVTVSDL
jgi:hypothetical protein